MQHRSHLHPSCFRLLVRRGAQVTRPLAAALAVGLLWSSSARLSCAQATSVTESAKQITLKQDGHIVLAYNKVSPPVPAGIDDAYHRSGFLHPVYTPDGRKVTGVFPPDHAHQDGIFSAWVNTTYDGKKVDFWNLAKGTGRVLHKRVVETFERPDRAGFVVDLIHRAETEPPVDVLSERWVITLRPTDGTYFCFDLETTQTALTNKPLLVAKYHYGGIALRGPVEWLTDKDSYARTHPDLRREPSGFLNNFGSERIAGNHQHARWVALWGGNKEHPASITMLCHRENFRAPQAARLHPTKPYCCYAPCVDGEFTIDRDHPYHGLYRFLVTDQRPDPEWLDHQWSVWSE